MTAFLSGQWFVDGTPGFLFLLALQESNAKHSLSLSLQGAHSRARENFLVTEEEVT